MPEAYKPIDVSNVPELLKLAEEVHATREPRVLRRDDEDLAVLMLVSKKAKRRRKQKSEKDLEAFRASASSWKDVDTDKLIADIYESRRRSSRPPVDL
ncbi:hypothetical protein [Nitrolancea hollandica]|uniref:Uncharacterized protein n=1 Tax=Nitrolancea hollandica Lb TaxID=1129897 RepID=I4EL69_9BACT|nr:hypothetical protein [Nitrolancea hollandica]CCF85431.1 hypothetical protein NITHO_4970002 [Nitrolancea hollandica Lb]